MFKTIADVKRRNKEIDRHFFEKSTMKFFNSKIESKLYGGKYFVTSEQFDENSKRKYTVRIANNDGSIDTIGRFSEFSSKEDAIEAIKKIIGEKK